VDNLREHRPRRGDEIEFEVAGAQHYGVLIRTNSGAPGWIEADHLSDSVVRREAWPPAGTRLRGLVLGVTRDGRIRVSLRPVDHHPSPGVWPPNDPQQA